jgi:hypothetical protein
MQSEDPVSKRIHEAVRRLTEEFQGTIPTETIVRSAEEAFGTYRESRVTDFIPLLVYRSTREYLGTVALHQARSGHGTLDSS